MKRSSCRQGLFLSGVPAQVNGLPDEVCTVCLLILKKSVYENLACVACMQLLLQIFAQAPEQHPALRLSCKHFASIVSRQLTRFRFASDTSAWQSKLADAGRRQYNAQMQLLPDHFPNVAELEVTCPTTQAYSSLRATNHFLSRIATRWRLTTMRLLGDARCKGYADIGNLVLPMLVANFPALAHVRIGLHAEKKAMQLLSQMTRLESLEIQFPTDASSITSEVWPSALLQLKSFSLSFNSITVVSATSPIFTMTRLCKLALNNVRFQSPEAVQACHLLSSLRCLQLDGLVDFAHGEMLSCIAAVTQLSELRLRNGDVHSHFPHATSVWHALGNMPQLQSLDITIDNQGTPSISPPGFSQLTCLTLRLDNAPMPVVPSNIRVLHLFVYSPSVHVADMHVPARLQGLPHLQALAVHSSACIWPGQDMERNLDELATILQLSGLPRLAFSSYWPIDRMQARIDAHLAAGGWNGKGVVLVPSPQHWPGL